MEDLFSLARKNRDAWAAIRGFAYQVDTTVARWLFLRAGEILELECGEDLDLLAPAIVDGELQLCRTLEQIKCSDRAFTLRSPGARQAFVSFTEHLKENPALPIQFRFVTTALPAAERPPLPLLFTPGIVLWQRIRENKIEADLRDQAIESIASFLQSIDAQSADAGWNQFLALTRNPDSFKDFVSRFDWSIGASGAEAVVTDILGTLVSQGRAPDRTSAKSLHDLLFVFVMRLLAQPKSHGPKRISLDDLEARLGSLLPISASESSVLVALSHLHAGIDRGFSDIRDGLADVKQDTEAIKGLIMRTVPEPALHRVVDEVEVRNVFQSVSLALLSWPTEISGRWLDRPELVTLENSIQNADNGCTVLLGAPGSGKSALLARLGQRLQAAGIVLLALKTDQLPGNIATVDDLDTYVGAKTSIVESVTEISGRERVVLLIDQLDALASLMDQKTSRLSAVLQLVYRLKSVKNVHLLISCREFDFRYDSRFTSLKANQVHLIDPPWDAVLPFLTSLQIPTEKWPADMREMLRNPQHLCVFVDNFSGDAIVFESYQNMLETMFTKRVSNASGFTSLTVEASEEIAAKMSEAEELWLPRASIERHFLHEVDRLLAAGILKQEGRRIGFRHQTLFDYVRTRAFCTGTRPLSNHVLSRQDAIFVRPTLWASLSALRPSSVARYHDEIGALWQTQTLRRHLRFMLISFLGQVNEPDDREAQMLLPALDDLRLRGKVLTAITGNRGWFERLQSRLPTLMNAPDEVTAWQVISLLQAALAFDRASVFSLMSRYWSEPSRDILILQTLRDLATWDEQSARVIEVILSRQPFASYQVVHLAKNAVKAGTGLGARFVAASIGAALSRATAAVEATRTDLTNTPDSIFAERKELAPIRQFVDSGDWYGLDKVAAAEPGPFVENLWPVFLQIAAILAEVKMPHLAQYRAAAEIELDGELGGRHSHIPEALKIGMELFAVQDPEGFHRFTETEKHNELMVIHRLMSYGFARVAATRPLDVLNYLIGDPRRLAIGGYDNRHKETIILVTAVSAKLTVDLLAPLEKFILEFRMQFDRPGDDADLRRHRRRWNRQHRLRLLRAFTADKLSADAKKILREEEIALPDTMDHDHRVEWSLIGSPVSDKQMAKASNQDILNLFDKLRDNTRDSHPLDFRRGGTAQASQAFAVFAKEVPARALMILNMLEPGTQEQPAAHALYSLADAEGIAGDTIVVLIKRLAKRGFSSPQFRDSASWAMQTSAVRCGGLDDDVCDLLKSWLTPAEKDEPEQPEKRDPTKQLHSLIWSPAWGGSLPQGNYTILSALGAVYRCRIPPDVDKWLDVLTGHLAFPEQASVWRTLMREFWVLGQASNRSGATDFLERLLARYPKLLHSMQGTMFLARSHSWLPADFLQRCLQSIELSGWPWSEQAIGEIAMLKATIEPDDQFCHAIVNRALECPEPGDASDLRRAGVAYACIRFWNEPRFREASHHILVALAGAGDGYLPKAIMDLFRVATYMVPDHRTGELLEILIAHPELIRRGGPSFLTERLRELLSSGFDANLVARTVRAILTASGPAVGDFRTAWASDAGDLIELAVALQRNQSSRNIGLEIFETLMDVGAFEADQVLRDMDRRL